MFALGFTVRADDVAVVIDLRVLRNLGVRLWRVAGYPDTPYYCPLGQGLLYAQNDIPPIAIQEVREFHADRGVVLYVNPYHRYLGYYAAVKLRNQHGDTPAAQEVFTRFVAQAGGEAFSTSEAGRILRSVVERVSGLHRARATARVVVVVVAGLAHSLRTLPLLTASRLRTKLLSPSLKYSGR